MNDVLERLLRAERAAHNSHSTVRVVRSGNAAKVLLIRRDKSVAFFDSFETKLSQKELDECYARAALRFALKSR